MTYQFLLYENILDTGTITASSTASGYSVQDVKQRLTEPYWVAGGTGNVWIKVDYGSTPSSAMTALAITGHNLFTAGATSITVSGSADDISYDPPVTVSPGPDRGDRTIVASGAFGAYRYYKVTFNGTTTAARVGILALGRRLDFPAAMALGFDPFAVRSASVHRHGNSIPGSTVGSALVRTITLKFPSEGMTTESFFESESLPSWRHYIANYWSKGVPVWIGSTAAWWPDEYTESWYCWPPQNAKSRAPYTSGVFRNWQAQFESLADDFMTAI